MLLFVFSEMFPDIFRLPDFVFRHLKEIGKTGIPHWVHFVRIISHTYPDLEPFAASGKSNRTFRTLRARAVSIEAISFFFFIQLIELPAPGKSRPPHTSMCSRAEIILAVVLPHAMSDACLRSVMNCAAAFFASAGFSPTVNWPTESINTVRTVRKSSRFHREKNGGLRIQKQPS